MKCKYCGKEAYQEEYCDELCKENAQKYLDKVAKYKNLFLVLVFIPVLLMPVFNQIIYTLLVTLYLGIVIILFPFTTPQMVRSFGIQKSQKIAKALGLVLIVIALVCGGIYFIA